MEMCDDFNSCILNGTFFGDEKGALTYTVQKETLADIAAVSNAILNRIQRFTVNYGIWSDRILSPTQKKMVVINKAIKKKTFTSNSIIPADEFKIYFENLLNATIPYSVYSYATPL
ncbi:hypothetical protein ACFFRR_009857 [Megaselia abdita]